jgi:hypothetical protein
VRKRGVVKKRQDGERDERKGRNRGGDIKGLKVHGKDAGKVRTGIGTEWSKEQQEDVFGKRCRQLRGGISWTLLPGSTSSWRG